MARRMGTWTDYSIPVPCTVKDVSYPEGVPDKPVGAGDMRPGPVQSATGPPRILDVGCGIRKQPGAIGIDRNAASRADALADQPFSLSLRGQLL